MGNYKVMLERQGAVVATRDQVSLRVSSGTQVDFAGTGMEPKDFIARVEKQAKIAVNHGISFGAGGDSFLRFNLATQRAVVVEAAERLKQAFADLQ